MTSRRTPSRSLFAVGLVAALAFGATACGGSDDGAIGQITSTTVAGPGDTVGGGVTVPSVPGLSADCQKLYAQFVQAMGGVGAGGEATDAGAIFENLKKVLPAELQSSAQTLSEAYAGLTTLIAKYNGDYAKAAADPAFQAAVQAMSKPETAAASKAIGDYFTAQCPQG